MNSTRERGRREHVWPILVQRRDSADNRRHRGQSGDARVRVTGNNSISSRAASTLGSHLTITGTITTISSPVAFDNQATIVADPTAQGLGQTSGTTALSGVNWTNEGTIGAAGNNESTLAHK